MVLVRVAHEAVDGLRRWLAQSAADETTNPDGAAVQRWVAQDDPTLGLLLTDVEAGTSVDGSEQRRSLPRTPDGLDGCIRFDHYHGRQREPGQQLAPSAAAAFYVVLINVAEPALEDFDRWFAEEHIDALARVPGVLAARRYESRTGPHRFFASYHLSDPSIPLGEAWLRAGASPWTDRIRPSMQDVERIVFLPYQQDAPATSDHATS